MTPTREEIESKARELYVAEQYRCGTPQLADLNPSVEELKESGFYMLAGNLLMREGDEYKDYLMEELGENPSDVEEKPKPFEFNIEEGERTGTIVVGGKGTGKSNLAKLLVDQYMRHGNVVKVFDVSKTWLKSSIPQYIEVVPNATYDISLYQSVVFDLSKLYPRQVKAFINLIIASEFQLQVNTPEHKRKWIIYVFEDSAVGLPRNRLTSKQSEELLRLMSVGRNYSLGYLAIIQRPSLLDVSVFELAFQRYISRLDGENDKRKIRAYIEKEYVDMLDSLKIGDFLYDIGDKTKKISTPLFTATSEPKKLVTQQQCTPQEPNLAIGYVIIGLAFLSWLILLIQWLRG